MANIDWTDSMVQTFEFTRVDPLTWYDDVILDNIKSASITIDSSNDTVSYATINGENINGEMYIRIYMKVIQNGYSFRIPLGTFLVQTSSISFNGLTNSNSVDAYSPLVELKEKHPPIGYYMPYTINMMNTIIKHTDDNIRAPVSKQNIELVIDSNDSGFVSEFNDTWLSFLTYLLGIAKYRYDLDPLGRVMFSPKQDTISLQPVWTYTDDENSIFYPNITMDRDLYGIPNVVEVLYSTETDYYVSVVKNEESGSPTSIQARGREIVHRATTPDSMKMERYQVDNYAKDLLKSLSSIEYTLSYRHGYCPVRVGDCVLLNYKAAGITNVKAVVTSQTIECKAGCSVSEKAVFTDNLWG